MKKIKYKYEAEKFCLLNLKGVATNPKEKTVNLQSASNLDVGSYDVRNRKDGAKQPSAIF